MSVRMYEDDVMFAKLSEESDFRWNQSRGDRLVVVGLSSKEYPTGLAERKEFLSAKLRPLIEDVMGEIVFDIYPKQANLLNERVPPFVLRFPSIKDCDKFKKRGIVHRCPSPTSKAPVFSLVSPQQPGSESRF